VLGAFVLKNSFMVFYKYFSTSFIFGLYTRLGDKLFRTYMHAPYTFHLGRNSSRLLRNVTQETQLLVVQFLFPFLKFLMDIGIVSGILILLLLVEPVMTFIVFGVLGGGSMLFMRILRSRIKKYGKQEQQYRGEMIQSVNEGLGGLKDVKVMSRTPFFTEKFRSDLSKTSNAFRFKEFIGQIIIPSVETFAVLGMLAIALFLLWQGRDLQSIIPLLALFITATARLMPAFKKTIQHYTILKYHSYVVDPVYDDLTYVESEEGAQADGTEIQPLEWKDKMEFRDVSYSYPESDGEKALDEVNLTIKKGEVIGFVGSSGAGKTTIVDVLLGLLKPDSGSVYADGKDIFSHLKAWQRNVGYIPQGIFLSDATIRENIAFGIPPELIDEERIRSAVKSAYMEEYVNQLPKGLDTVIGEAGVRLSGGQRQRIGIARALYHDPEILIMDEATSALDNQTERYVMESVEQLKKERTIIMIAHRLSTVRNADKLFLMNRGRIEASGTYDQLLAKSGKFRELAEF